MQNLTKKDKIMLYVVGLIALVFVLAKLIIMPMLSSYTELNDQLDEAEEKMQTMQMTIAQHDSAKAQLENSKAQFKELQMSFYPYMNNNGIDEIITQSLLMYNLIPQKADIKNAESKIIEPYFASQLGIERAKRLEASQPQNNTDSTDLDADTSSSAPAQEVPNEYVLVSEMTYTVLGEPQDLYRFMDYAASQTALQVNGFNVSYTLYNRLNGAANITINMSIYMYKPDSLID